MELDLIIRGGTVLDGTGAPGQQRDLGIEAGRIAVIGDLEGATAPAVLDATGLVVTPGFIDTHTHSDGACFLPDEAQQVKVAALRQGVTTEVCGNCGFSPFPILPETRADSARLVGMLLQGLPLDWSTLDEYAGRAEDAGLHANLAPLVGHGSIRAAVMGYAGRPPERHEMDRMKDLVRESLEMGAFGLSSGLIYAPGQYASTEEVAELARVAAEVGRPYCTHMRGESDMVAESVAEALEIGRASGAAVHISHHKVAGRENWGRTHQTLRMLDEARRAGQDVTCDVYPYTAGSTILPALLPGWAQEGGLEVMLDRLQDRTSRERIRREWEEPGRTWENMVRGAGWEHIRIATCPGRPEYEGHSMTELAEHTGTRPADVAMDVIVEQRGMVTIILEMMDEDDVRRVIAYEGSVIGSDGIPAPGKPHPRWAGTFPRVLGRYSREERLLTLADAVHKMTGMAAARFGLDDRGTLAPGKAADVVVLDAGRIADRATYDEPLLTPIGVQNVVVNGQPVILGRELTGAKPGRVLRAG